VSCHSFTRYEAGICTYSAPLDDHRKMAVVTPANKSPDRWATRESPICFRKRICDLAIDQYRQSMIEAGPVIGGERRVLEEQSMLTSVTVSCHRPEGA
ncbi:hypothetical protein, partial [uncultured Marinobacter sp.]|uniref:hypothetical protein n=1 Tax=uncultured Marinobacter sp. TaxID=187379 RepID=UPI0030DA3334